MKLIFDIFNIKKNWDQWNKIIIFIEKKKI
jgi:hypothetical protein